MKKERVAVELFGCPEDWNCQGHGSHNGPDTAHCKDCTLPVCRSCGIKLATANGRNNVPMALANDNWYGYVQDIIA
eukprot:12368380-Karenia_brevis.AAC.1